MQEQTMRRLRQGGGLALAIAVASTLLSVACAPLGWLGSLDDFAYDQALVRFSPRPEKSKDIVLVAIDDATFQSVARNPELRQALGAWPYTRSVWGQVLQYVEAREWSGVVLSEGDFISFAAFLPAQGKVLVGIKGAYHYPMRLPNVALV